MTNQEREERRLQELAESLPLASASFCADDVRVRLGRSSGPRRPWGIAAALLAALTLSHAGAYLLGSRGRDGADVDPMLLTERLLARAAGLDPGAPPEVLRGELGDLRRDIRLASLPERLESLPDRRAPRFADALAQLDLVFERFSDPGISVMMVTNIARASLHGEPPWRLLPESTRSFARVVPLGGQRYRVFVIDTARGVALQDEGTLQELRTQHPTIQFISGD